MVAVKGNDTVDYAGRLGSVSSATMRAEDLIPRFLSVLEWLDVDRYCEIVGEYRDLPCFDVDPNDPHGVVYAGFDWHDLSEDDRDGVNWLLNETLFDVLNEYAPPYCYFGSHIGDGADYGYWVYWEGIDDELRSGELAKITDSDVANGVVADRIYDNGASEYGVQVDRFGDPNALWERLDNGTVRIVWSV